VFCPSPGSRPVIVRSGHEISGKRWLPLAEAKRAPRP
jgi:hypothetical protein